jgi:hypothetical protein
MPDVHVENRMMASANAVRSNEHSAWPDIRTPVSKCHGSAMEISHRPAVPSRVNSPNSRHKKASYWEADGWRDPQGVAP